MLLWQSFFHQVREDVFLLHNPDAHQVKDMGGNIPFDYYALLYGHNPQAFMRQFYGQVMNRLRAHGILRRMYGYFLLCRVVRQGRWLQTVAVDQGSAVAIDVPGFESKYQFVNHKFEVLDYQLMVLANIQNQPAVVAQMAVEGPMLRWFLLGQEDETQQDSVTDVIYDSLGLLRRAQQRYPRWWRTYKTLYTPQTG